MNIRDKIRIGMVQFGLCYGVIKNDGSILSDEELFDFHVWNFLRLRNRFVEEMRRLIESHSLLVHSFNNRLQDFLR